MGLGVSRLHPIPLLASPLKGEERLYRTGFGYFVA